MSHLIQSALISILFLVTSYSTFATDYYWVGGSGSWNDITHWDSVSGGPGNVFVAQPNASDDVYFDSNSGLASGNTITFPNASTSTCNNLTFSTGATGIVIAGGTTARFDVNGSVTLEADMSFPWRGEWYMYQSTTGLTNTFTTANNIFINNLIRFEKPSAGTGGDFNIIDKFIHTTTGGYLYAKTTVNLQNATDKVTFNDTAYFSNSYINQIGFDVVVGEVSTMFGFQSGNIHVGGQGKLFNYGDCVGENVAIEGEVDFNKGNTAAGNNLGLQGISNGDNSSVYLGYGSGSFWWNGGKGQAGADLKFVNCDLTLRSYFVFGSGRLYNNTAANTPIDATGSTMTFKTSATLFAISNHTFNNVVVEGGTNTVFQIMGAGPQGVSTPTLDTLIAERSTNYLNYTGVSANHYTRMQITGYLKFTGGNNYGGRIDRSRFYMVSGADLDMQGNCSEPVGLSGITHYMTGVGTITTNNLLFRGNCVATPGTYPAGAGSRALTGVSVTGWTFGAVARRILVWTGAIPSNIADHTTYANWYVDTNWCDVTANPTWNTDPNIAPGNPGYCAPVCPPTEIDSLIFPDLSYVRCLESVMYAESINWMENGRIYATTAQDLEIWGALHLSSEMTNSFLGTYRFRSNRTYRCHITSNGNTIQSAYFNSENGLGEWLLTDNFRTVQNDSECKLNSGPSSWRIRSGHLYSGTLACTPGNGVRIDALGFNMDGGEFSMFDSDVHITVPGTYMTNAGYFNVRVYNAATINSGTSQFILRTSRASSSATFGCKAWFGNDTLYDIRLENSNTNGTGNITHHLILGENASVHHLDFDGYTRAQVGVLGTDANPTFIQKINSNSLLSSNRGVILRGAGGSMAISKAYTLVVDTLYNNGQLNLGLDLFVNNELEMVPGYSHILGTSSNPAATAFCSLTLNGVQSGTHPYLNACPGGGTVNYTGATANISGDCFNGGNTIISNGTFIINTPQPFTPSFLTLNNNQITGPGTPYSTPSSSFAGITTGWDGSSSPAARTLRWVDNSSTASNIGDFQDANYWEQVLPVYAAAPQCPPNKTDTVLFNNTSFSANNQRVNLTGVTSIASMYWENITAGQNPRLTGVASQNLSLSANLAFHANMTNSFLGSIYLSAKAGTNDFYITSAGNSINYRLLIRGDANTSWHLTDDLYISGTSRDNQIVLYRGQFYTEGHNVSTPRFQSVNEGGVYRKLDITNSTITTRYASHYAYPEWNMTGTMVDGSIANFDLITPGSTLYATQGFGNNHYSSSDVYVLGGKRYNRIITAGSRHTRIGIAGFSRDTINEFIGHENSSSYSSITECYLNSDSIYILKATLNKPYSIHTEGGRYDTLILNHNANITSNNKYYNYLYLAPDKIYNLTSGKVQWLQNKSEISLNGGNTSTPIQFYGTSTANPSYIRKDSGFVCANFVNIRDMWAIGNGNDLVSTCDEGVNNYCPNGNAWIESSCDTIVPSDDVCGPWNSDQPTRGRADFNGGEFADLQGGNTRGWDKTPYPEDPILSLPKIDSNVCEFDVVPITFTFTGALPAYLTYDSLGVEVTIVLTASDADFGSQDVTGEGTVADPFVWTFNHTITNITTEFSPSDLTFDKCFINAPAVSGGLKFNQICGLPVELLNFNAVKKDMTTLLDWQTASEINNDYFNVQRSADGFEFKTIGKINGNGNSNTIINYDFEDKNPLTGINYYRLKQVDFNGEFEYSDVRAVNFELDAVLIYPNPASDIINIKTPFKEGLYTIYDISGKKMTQGNLSKGNQQINVSSLSKGIYFIETVNTNTGERDRLKVKLN